MGLTGKEYDERNPEFTPNKDRRIKEWREKKAAESKSAAEASASEAVKKEAEKEERKELDGPVTPTPLSSSDSTLLDAINNGTPGAPAVRPRRRKAHFDSGTNHPTLF